MTTEVNNHMSLKGIFNLKFTNVKTGEVREHEFTNLILNSGLDRVATGALVAGCILGSGSSTPVVTDTTISNILGTSTSLNSSGTSTANTTTPPYWCSYYWTYRFIEGQATGNISQVAMAYGSVNDTTNAYTGLFSLALIKDSGGTPITITKLADEVLDVTYTLQLYCPAADATGIVDISGVSYNYIARPAYATSWRADLSFSSFGSSVFHGTYTGEIGTQLSYPSGADIGTPTSMTLASYTTGNYYRDAAYFWDLNAGNHASGIKSLYLLMGYSNQTMWQIQYTKVSDSTSIPKTAAKKLTLNVRYSWGRV